MFNRIRKEDKKTGTNSGEGYHDSLEEIYINDSFELDYDPILTPTIKDYYKPTSSVSQHTRQKSHSKTHAPSATSRSRESSGRSSDSVDGLIRITPRITPKQHQHPSPRLQPAEMNKLSLKSPFGGKQPLTFTEHKDPPAKEKTRDEVIKAKEAKEAAKAEALREKEVVAKAKEAAKAEKAAAKKEQMRTMGEYAELLMPPDNEPEITNEPIKYANNKPYNKRTVEDILKDEPDYLKERTTDMGYVEVDIKSIKIGDKVRYINSSGILINGGYIQEKDFDRIDKLYYFRVSVRSTGGYAWSLVSDRIQKIWKNTQPSIEDHVNAIVKFIEAKFPGQLAKFYEGPVRSTKD
jgi:hypothetical protein